MAIAGNLALLVGAKGRLGKTHFAGAASTPAAVSLRRIVPSPASLLRLPPLARSAPPRCSLAVVRVAGRNSSYHGDFILEVDEKAFSLRDEKVSGVKRRVLMVGLICLCLWIGLMAYKAYNWAVACRTL